MYSIIKPIAAVFVFSLSVFSQQISRDQKIQSIIDLRSQLSTLEKDVLQPDANDIALAQKQNLNVIRLLPREKYDHLLAVNGGGAYYSFVFRTHEYGHGSDIELSRGKLSVGFAGADYGFLIDLGQIDLAEVGKDSLELDFLVKYSPPTDEPAVRSEQTKSHNYEVNGVLYKREIPAIVGHTYALRSISISDSDILIACNVLRKDSDGSLIILWKPIETFDKPQMRRQSERAAR